MCGNTTTPPTNHGLCQQTDVGWGRGDWTCLHQTCRAAEPPARPPISKEAIIGIGVGGGGGLVLLIAAAACIYNCREKPPGLENLRFPGHAQEPNNAHAGVPIASNEGAGGLDVNAAANPVP